MFGRESASRLAVLLAGLLATVGQTEAGFTIRDLGVLSPGGTSGARAINASGEAAGMASSGGSGVAVATTGGGSFQALPAGNGSSSFATGINNSGDVAGTMVDATDHQSHAFAIVGNSFHEFGPLVVDGHRGGGTQANGISADGEVVGTGTIAGRDVGGVYTPYAFPTQAAFRGTGSQSTSIIKPLGTGQANYGNGINASGTVVGASEISANGPLHAFLAQRDGSVTDLLARNAPGGFVFDTEGTAINDQGDVVGNGILGNRNHAFFASHAGGSLVDLGLLGGTSSFAYGLNNVPSPLVVGEVDYGLSDPHAFLWDASAGMKDLRSLLSDADQAAWTQLIRANAINDAGQIAGVGNFQGQMHGFLLTPSQDPSISIPPVPLAVPAPPALVMVSIGGVLAVGAARLRRGRSGGRAAA